MGEILSQKEIDALLQNMASGDSIVEDVPGKKDAKPYDFARPSKFNKEQLRTLEIIFDNYARSLASYLTGYLRTTTAIEVASAEQVTYSEFSNILINPVILAIVEFAPLKGSLILELSANLGYAIIERILGGAGVGLKKIRDFSDLEKILLERVLNQTLTYLPEAFSNVADIRPRIDKLETNSQFAQIISPNEMNALITLNVKVGSVEGLMNFCIPHLVIEPVMDRLNTKFWFTVTDDDRDSHSSEVIEERLEKAKIPLRVIIGKTHIAVSDFVSLQIGDVLPLDTYASSDLSIMVGDLLKFTGKPGISRGKNAVQITSFVESEG